MTQVFHGGNLEAVRRANPSVSGPWIDLSTGVNPVSWPWWDRVPKDVLGAATQHLPQSTAEAACAQAWTDYLRVQGDAEEWSCVSGSQAVINILPDLFPEQRAVIPTPCFGEYERPWRLANRDCNVPGRGEVTDFDPDEKTVVILTNPNNPDGFVWSRDLLLDMARDLEKKDGWLVVDEAFGDVAPQTSLANLVLPDNVLVLLSFGKFFGLAGLRLGLVRAKGEVQERLKDCAGPWSVNGPALTIAQRALADQDWIDETRDRLHQDMAALHATLQSTGFKIIGGTSLFCLVHHEMAQERYNALVGSGILARRFPDEPTWLRFGLPKNTSLLLRLKEALT